MNDEIETKETTLSEMKMRYTSYDIHYKIKEIMRTLEIDILVAKEKLKILNYLKS